MGELSETVTVVLEFPTYQIVKSFSKGENKHSGSSNPIDHIALGKVLKKIQIFICFSWFRHCIAIHGDECG